MQHSVYFAGATVAVYRAGASNISQGGGCLAQSGSMAATTTRQGGVAHMRTRKDVRCQCRLTTVRLEPCGAKMKVREAMPDVL